MMEWMDEYSKVGRKSAEKNTQIARKARFMEPRVVEFMIGTVG
jgi:hypothetical protein